MKKLLLLSGVLSLMLSCNKSELEDYEIPPSSGSTIELSGLVGGEAGTMAGNIVFVDFSTDKQSTMLRAGWDLGFYCGDDFRVIINNTTAAMAHITDKTDLDAVSTADADGVTFEVDITNPTDNTFSKIDDLDGDITKTVIPEIVTDINQSKVIIIGRGTGGGTPRRDLVKVQITKTNAGTYAVKWSKLNENNYQTAEVTKDSDHSFKYLSFDNGAELAAPKKKEWDIVWGTSIFRTLNGSTMTAYIFSDMVAINYLAGVTSAEKIYDTEVLATEAYNNYALADAQNEEMKNDRWNIGAKWRTTAAPGVASGGVKKDRFYIVKDTEGNYYKLQFLSFSSDDGGTRGKPKLEYEILK